MVGLGIVEMPKIYQSEHEIEDAVFGKDGAILLIVGAFFLLAASLAHEIFFASWRREDLWQLVYPQEGHSAYDRLVGKWVEEKRNND